MTRRYLAGVDQPATINATVPLSQIGAAVTGEPWIKSLAIINFMFKIFFLETKTDSP